VVDACLAGRFLEKRAAPREQTKYCHKCRASRRSNTRTVYIPYYGAIEDEMGMELEIARLVKQFPIQYC
jgi:hypothetical protein